MCQIRIPATKNSTPAVSAITIVAPKSGSATASPISTPTMATAGSAPFQKRSMRQPMRSSSTLVATTARIFPNSLGCIRIAPSRSQRLEPFVGSKASTAAISRTTMQ